MKMIPLFLQGVLFCSFFFLLATHAPLAAQSQNETPDSTTTQKNRRKVKITIEKDGKTEVYETEDFDIQVDVEELEDIADIRIWRGKQGKIKRPIFDFDFKIDGEAFSQELRTDIEAAMRDMEDALQDVAEMFEDFPQIDVQIEEQARGYRYRFPTDEDEARQKSTYAIKTIHFENLSPNELPQAFNTQLSDNQIEALPDNRCQITPQVSEGSFDIKLKDIKKETVFIALYRDSGALQHEEMREAVEGDFQTQIDLRGYGAGTYFLRTQVGKQTKWQKVVVTAAL
ncbi:hypothetical protein [Hugenholtzia roseola]|uniref:hypothetical protein n=1 Tax=Hugenholtzia roseola TaxID=1002 RepID=UPI00047D7F14|nr:hypothetical protein [Hugenholtzia roseola]